MTWAQLAKAFVRVIVPFAFLASAPVVLHIIADIGPPYPSVSVIAAVVSVLCIAYVFLTLNGRAAYRIKRWTIRSGIVVLVVLPMYVLAERTLVYQTDPPNNVRRIRGFIPIGPDQEIYIKQKGSVKEALRGNDWESDGLFTESSKNISNLVILIGWNVLFSSLCIVIASFAIHQNRKPGKRDPASGA
jgi:hypothetical protein